MFFAVLIFGGIDGWIFTPTEAAAVAAVSAFLILSFIYCNMGPLKVGQTAEQIPQQIAGAMLGAGLGPVMFLIMVTCIPWISTVLPTDSMEPEIITR